MGFEIHILFSYVVLLLAVKCYGLPLKEQNHANQLQLPVKGFEYSSSSMGKREIDQEAYDHQELSQRNIGSNVENQKNLETLLQEAKPIKQNTFVFQNVDQSDFGHNNKNSYLSNTFNDVNTERVPRINGNYTSERKDIIANPSYATSRQEIMHNRNNSVNESFPVRQEELDSLIQRVFGSNSVLKNDSLNIKEHQLNKTSVNSNILKEVFGNNWDRENKPIKKESLDTIQKNSVITGSQYPTDESNSHNGDKTAQEFFHEVFGKNWDIENKPISQDNLELNLFRPSSKANEITNHIVEDKQSGQGQETLLFENKYSQQHWGRDYELPDLRPYGKDVWPYRWGSRYSTWNRHSIHNDVQRDRADFFGNGKDSKIFHQNGIETDSSTCDDDHDDKEFLINYNT